MTKKTMMFVCGLFVVSCAGQPMTKVDQWKVAGMLPSPEGFAESIGVAASYAEFIGNYLVVAGGANFPYAPIIEGGTKEFYSDIFVFRVKEDNTLELVNMGMLPKKLSGGATVSTGDEIFLIGGENGEEESSAIYSITLQNAVPVVKEVAVLPFTWAYGAATIQNRTLYLFSGRNNKTAVNKSWTFDLDSKVLTALSDLPGEARVQMPYAVSGGKVYLFTGIGKLTLTDNYVYEIATDTWTKLADTVFNNKAFTVAGGAAVPLTKDSIIILGGVNREVFNDAVTKLGTLQGEELKAFRQDYFNRTPEQFKFSKQQMVYNISKNQWSDLGTIPFYGGAGPFPLLKKDLNLWLISGEIKAGVRTPEIRVGTITTN